MDYEKAFKALVQKVDKGYVLINLVKQGIVPNDKNWDDNYINGVLGAYQNIEKKIQEIAEKHKEEEG